MMYETFFGLKKRPFSTIPDTEAYFDAGSIAETRKTIENIIRDGEGLSLVFGAAGTGKTLLLRLLRQNLEWNYTALPIINGLLDSAKVLFQQLLYHLHIPFSGNSAAELRMQLFDYVKEQNAHGAANDIILLFDESQYIYPDVLEEIRLLADDTDCRFHIVLAGSNEFEEKLTIPQLEAFNQRVAARCYLDSFTCEETIRYITWQMQHSQQIPAPRETAATAALLEQISAAEAMQRTGADEVSRIDPPHQNQHLLFSENAKRRIHILTGGLPRLINQTCDKTLRLAAARSTLRIDESAVNEAWSLIQQIEPAAIILPDEDTDVIPLPEVQDIESANIDEVIAQKRTLLQNNELQLRPFEAAVEFGSLDDDDETCCRQQYPIQSNNGVVTGHDNTGFSVYKPAYPEFDDDSDGKEADTADEAKDDTGGCLAGEEVSTLSITGAQWTDTFSEGDMDAKTLEEYRAAVLKDRPPFVRREPDYAYQTTATAPESVRNVEYPDSETGSVVVLNWQTAQKDEGRFGVSYSEYQREHVDAGSSLQPQTQSGENRAAGCSQSSLDEVFAETQEVAAKTVPISAVYQINTSIDVCSRQQYPTQRSDSGTAGSISAVIEEHLGSVVARITAAAEKIEQAAETSHSAGQHITESAQMIEAEIKTVLPSYLEMFQELSEFQRTVLSELNVMRLNTDTANVHSLPPGVSPRRQIAIERSVPTIGIDSLFQ
ncbi:MAG: AAA family ATPase [Planctomycetaceae bacterium]|jgi:type II secretory pathway predicted ATPase ExeA|nr:AAA family ATPase [Planctomycetaceae bacterium]